MNEPSKSDEPKGNRAKGFDLLQCVKAHPSVLDGLDTEAMEMALNDRGLIVASDNKESEVLWNRPRRYAVLPNACLLPAKLT